MRFIPHRPLATVRRCLSGSPLLGPPLLGLPLLGLPLLGLATWSCSEQAPSAPGSPGSGFGGAAASHSGGAAGEANGTTSSANAVTGASGSITPGGADASGAGGAEANGTTSSANAVTGAPGSITPGGADASGAGGAPPSPPLGPDGYPAQCPKEIPRDPAATRETPLRVSLHLEGEPFIFGEPNSLPQGGTVIPTNFRFYLSQFAFHQGEQRVTALPVDAEGEPLPYGVSLVNSERAPSLTLRLQSAPGDYDSLSFSLGLPEACNQAFFPLDPPLDEASQLKWPHALGFLFLRFEAILDETALATVPSKIHMGAAAGPEGQAPRFQFALIDPAAGTLELTVAMSRLFEGATSEIDLTDFKLPEPAPPNLAEEILAGERLRRTARSLAIFALSSNP